MDEVKEEILDARIFDEIRRAVYNEGDALTFSHLAEKLNISKSSIRTYINAVTIYELVNYFLENSNLTIKELSVRMKIPSSTVQRFLNSELIDQIPEFRGKDLSIKIKKMLAKTKNYGKQLGGINSSMNNIYLKDEKGHFAGSKKR